MDDLHPFPFFVLQGIAHHINDMKRKHEHAVRVQEVQSLLDSWPGEDLTTYGELVAEGSFRMYGAKAPRHVFLLDRMLLIVKRKDDGTLGYKTHIMVKKRNQSRLLLTGPPASIDLCHPSVF